MNRFGQQKGKLNGQIKEEKIIGPSKVTEPAHGTARDPNRTEHPRTGAFQPHGSAYIIHPDPFDARPQLRPTSDRRTGGTGALMSSPGPRPLHLIRASLRR
ncbi:hypothetical protein ROHU_021230 [Labeo rohita]|uniref:Uncharacterized protein n=1 Tax=Labeo rohita TaxID=84645 RepID=A0A498N185_LABRO|nr:hypothetical protein ROHU_021230 [Labeo rohita]